MILWCYGHFDEAQGAKVSRKHPLPNSDEPARQKTPRTKQDGCAQKIRDVETTTGQPWVMLGTPNSYSYETPPALPYFGKLSHDKNQT